MLRKKGLQKIIINLENTASSKSNNNKIPEIAIISGYQWACNLHFLNVECLERSITLYKLLLSSSYEGRLCIGIKRKPFLSHAWVETNIEKLDERKYREQFNVFLTASKEGE